MRITKRYILILLALTGIYSCQKQETHSSHQTYKDIVYRIYTADSNLQVNLMRGVYNDVQRGNIGKDTLLVDTGLYNIHATVLTGVKVTLFGMSTTTSDFNLKIIDDKGNVLAETDTITHYPANRVHPEDQYISRISITP